MCQAHEELRILRFQEHDNPCPAGAFTVTTEVARGGHHIWQGGRCRQFGKKETGQEGTSPAPQPHREGAEGGSHVGGTAFPPRGTAGAKAPSWEPACPLGGASRGPAGLASWEGGGKVSEDWTRGPLRSPGGRAEKGHYRSGWRGCRLGWTWQQECPHHLLL